MALQKGMRRQTPYWWSTFEVWAEGNPKRGKECLSAYPFGAVITITAKPSVAIGFIPKEQTVDPKTGATTFTDIELLEVSEIKPK